MNALEYAINMELDGEKYYNEQAEINKNNSLYAVCLMLARDEKNHARILSHRLSDMVYELEETDALLQAKNIFKDIGDIKVETKEVLSQLDFYEIASEKEKQSIDHYTGFLSKATEAKEKELFEYLIKQEKQHYEVLEELASLLRKAEEWVESAEFGIRKEY
jgi:rubrerythrin